MTMIQFPKFKGSEGGTERRGQEESTSNLIAGEYTEEEEMSKLESDAEINEKFKTIAKTIHNSTGTTDEGNYKT